MRKFYFHLFCLLVLSCFWHKVQSQNATEKSPTSTARAAATCTFTPTNVFNTGPGWVGFIASAQVGGMKYIPDGTLNGAPKWKADGNYPYRLVWTGSVWEFQDTSAGNMTIARNSTGSITNLPCSATGWVDPSGYYDYFDPSGMTLSGGCGSLVAQTVAPAASIAANPGTTINGGTSVTFTATPTNGGATPTYQWKKNDANVGTNSSTYSDATLANGDKIKVVMTSSDGCASPTTATSNELTMTVNTAPAALCITTECTGVSGNYTKGSDYNSRPTYTRGGYSIFQADLSWFLVLGEVGDRTNIVYEALSTAQVPPTVGWGSNICEDIDITISLAACPCVNPTAFTVSGGGSYCAGGTGNFTISLSNSEVGINYQLKNGSTTIGLPKAGTGSGLTFDNISDAGTYTIEATRVAGGCSVAMTGSATITVISLPTAYNVTGGGSYCAGGAGVAVGLSNSQTGVNYQLKKDGSNVGSAVAGTVSALPFGNQTGAGTYTVEATTSTGGCTATMTGSVDVTVISLPTAYNVTGGGSYCAGGTGVAVGLSNSQTGVNYQLKKGGSNVGSVVAGTGSTLPFGNQTGAGTYTVEATTATGGCTATMTGSVDVTVISLPTAYNVTGGGSYCAGGTGVAVGLSNSQTGVNYQLKKDGNNVGSAVAGTGSSLPFGNQTDAGSYTVEATTTTGSCVSSMTGSVTVSINALPTAFSVTGGGSYCQGGTGVLVGLNSSSTGINYQLMLGSTLIGSSLPGTGSALSFGLQMSVGTYTVVATNATTNCTLGMSGSAQVTTYPLPLGNLSGTTTACKGGAGSPLTFTGSNGTAPYTFSYQLNGGAVQTISTTGISSSVTLIQSNSVEGVYTYTLVSVSDANCSQSQSGLAVVSVQTKPVITMSTQQMTFNEGNSQELCDIDSNPVNVLQFNVTTACIVGNPVWRVQVGSGAWSGWSSSAPTSQMSNNQVHRYQAACDGNCPSTYTSPIEVKINYRASMPQNVSLVADGVIVAAGETKDICNIEGNAIVFNASCAAGEVILYSVDGGDYSNVVPTQLVDGQYHTYRVRCRKSDGTASCVETESGAMRLRLTSMSLVPVASLSATSGCGVATSFSGSANCGTMSTIWYNASTDVALTGLPSVTPSVTTSYYARCQSESGCMSEKSNVVTYTVAAVSAVPVVTVSSAIVCTGVEVTVSTNCPAGSSALWNTGVTESSFKVSFANVTKQSYSVRCVYANGCQSSASASQEVMWKAFELTIINIGESKSGIKANSRSAWAGQFVTADAGPSLDQSTEGNPTVYYSENLNKTAPRYWTIHVDACSLGESGSLTYDLLATPETGVVRSYNTHENNAPYFMFANRTGYTELYAQNHPLYGFYADNGSGGNVYDEGFPKGLYKLGVRYWDMKGWGSIYPSTRKPQGNVLAYQEYWFRIQSKDGIGVGAARAAESGEQLVVSEEANGKWQGATNLSPWKGLKSTDNGTFATVLPNPVTNVLRLKVQESKGEVIKTELMDVSGRRVMTHNFMAESNAHLEEMEVEGLANGMYFLKVRTESKETQLKIIKLN